RPVKAVSNNVILDRLCEGWPASAGLKLLRRVEEDRVAAEAGIDSWPKEAAHFRSEGALRSGLPGDVVFLVTKLFAPFGVRLDNLPIRCRIAALRQIQNIGPFEHHIYILATDLR